MNKRLTLSDYLFTLAFILMMILAVFAFFYGVRVGNQQADARYQPMLLQQQLLSHDLEAYHQQYLVSFYHTIYSPYQEFQRTWFEHMQTIEVRSTADPASLVRELGRLAEEKYESALTMTMPESSPLLVQAHDNYLKSLKLFADGSKRIGGQLSGRSGLAAVSEIEREAFFQEAKNFALTAQEQYYSAIVRWHEALVPGIALAEGLPSPLGIQQWRTLPLNLKNAYIAKQMAAQRHFRPYKPQDLTARIDEMVLTGHAARMNISTIQEIIDVLVSTGAVRQGDYLSGKDRWYTGELLPQLPFFTDTF